MNTPVLFLIFNRPDVTEEVFNAIKIAKPPKLFVAADGPRNGQKDDVAKCEQTRAIINQVDWTCEVKVLYQSQNLGCRMAVSSAIDWFFQNVEEGIILEDDCLPHPDFFFFCETLLAKYRHESSVMHISGDNFQFGVQRGPNSYYFSRISHIWGWASWRRAWQKYDVDMKDYPEFLERNKQKSIFTNAKSEKYWLFLFDRVYRKAGTWDYQWTYAVMKNHGFCIMPNVNLISNIGFGQQATHTSKKNDRLAKMDVYPLKEITHPLKIAVDESADQYTIDEVFPIPSLPARAAAKALKILKNLIS